RDILPAAQVSLRNYFRGNYLNSTFFKDFIWVHPEYVEFATCVVCLSGIPNDPYWESDFQLYCQEEEATTLVKDELPDEQNGIL
ncbi:MAG: hypothetical protein NXH75_16575, partial [Halobacteriovoraceae bacterium]|nr:hypothetical protein [Halobacteriovoraceae bacterium]